MIYVVFLLLVTGIVWVVPYTYLNKDYLLAKIWLVLVLFVILIVFYVQI